MQPWHTFFLLIQNKKAIIILKYFIVFLFSFSYYFASAQKIDSIYVNLYTDSLKKGTFNYINIDGKLSNGRYQPLDTSAVAFTSCDANFTGNDIWIPRDFDKDKVTIHVRLLSNPAVCKTFSVYIKMLPDPELKTEKQILEEMKKSEKKKKES